MAHDDGIDEVAPPGVLVALVTAFVVVGLSCVGMLANDHPDRLAPLPAVSAAGTIRWR